MKKTIVLGASPNPARYAYAAVLALTRQGHEAIPVGIREGEIEGIAIQQMPAETGVDTVTLYLNAGRQQSYCDYILSLQPKRLIFNPGAENPELKRLARANGIEVVEDCTLVMLSVGAY